jgi:hypothetical protein
MGVWAGRASHGLGHFSHRPSTVRVSVLRMERLVGPAGRRRSLAALASRLAPAMFGRLLFPLEKRLAQWGLPRRAGALKGAVLLGVLVGIIAALIALSVGATSPSDTIADGGAVPLAAEVPPQPVAPAPQPAPEVVPVALTSPTPEPLVLPAAPVAATSGASKNALQRHDAGPQPQAAAKLAGYRGGLEIGSDPDGARVFIDGEAVGSAPLQLKDLPVGSRGVRVEAEGYATWTTAARVVANKRARISAVLQRSSQR